MGLMFEADKACYAVLPVEGESDEEYARRLFEAHCRAIDAHFGLLTSDSQFDRLATPYRMEWIAFAGRQRERLTVLGQQQRGNVREAKERGRVNRRPFLRKRN